MAGQTLLTNIIGLICVFFMSYLKIQNMVTCIIFGAARFVLLYTNLTSIALISQIRYYIARKASRAEVYSKNFLQCVVGIVYVIFIKFNFFEATLYEIFLFIFVKLNYCSLLNIIVFSAIILEIYFYFSFNTYFFSKFKKFNAPKL